jgi:hypothetical protein
MPDAAVICPAAQTYKRRPVGVVPRREQRAEPDCRKAIVVPKTSRSMADRNHIMNAI